MPKGKLYGIGVGPGDPELMTLKAVKAIQHCCVIAVPKTGKEEKTAFSIVEKYLVGKEIWECRFSMDRDIAKREHARRIVAGDIIRYLDLGSDVGFVTLGDPTTYSTYMYIHEMVAGEGFDTEIIPGITSYAAAAAAMGIALCEGDETLTIIPGGHGESTDALLEYPGNKVVMKSGANLANVLDKLAQRGYGERTKIVCRATMEGQRLYHSIQEYKDSPEEGYFTLAIVKAKD
jgi:precorrin-2/cobalt-factor-2 C20-methyltransferase